MQYDICMLVDNDMTRDSRVQREAQTLANAGWKVIVIAYSRKTATKSNLPEWEEKDGYTIWRLVIPVTKLYRIRDGIFLRLLSYATLPFSVTLFNKAFRTWKIALRTPINALKQIDAKVYHAHDYVCLCAIHDVYADKKTIIYDSHELYFEQRKESEKSYLKRWIDNKEKLNEIRMAQKCKHVITVGDKVAEHLEKTFKVQKPIVIRNAVDLRTASAEIGRKYPDGNYRIITQSGSITRGRYLYELVDSLQFLPDDIILVLLGQGPLTSELILRSTEAGTANRLHIVPFVEPNEIAKTLSQANVATVLAESFALSYHYALPNKFFEAVAAGLPIVSSSNPELENLVQHYNLGIVTDAKSPEKIAQSILQVLEHDNYKTYQANVIKAQNEINWEKEEKKLITLYASIIQ